MVPKINYFFCGMYFETIQKKLDFNEIILEQYSSFESSVVRLCWSLIRASFLKSGATRQIFTRQLGSNNLDRDRLTMCLVSFYIEKFLYDLDEYIQHTCTTYYIQSDTSSTKLLQQNSIMCCFFNSIESIDFSNNTKLQTTSYNKVLGRSLFYEVTESEIWTGLGGWTVQNSEISCTFQKSFEQCIVIRLTKYKGENDVLNTHLFLFHKLPIF